LPTRGQPLWQQAPHVRRRVQIVHEIHGKPLALVNTG